MKRRNFLATVPAVAGTSAVAAPMVQMHEADVTPIVSSVERIPMILEADGTLRAIRAFTPAKGDVYTLRFSTEPVTGGGIMVEVRRSPNSSAS